MKTAISLPDATFERATEKSKELGISRSEFFARAAEVYLDQLAGHSLARQIDEALETAGADESGPVAVSAGRRRLAEDDW
jgi:predicted DNA-binding protein